MTSLGAAGQSVAATTADAASVGGSGVTVHTGFTPVWPGARIHGPAFTVRGRGGDNLALHQAVVAAPCGTVIVADVDGDCEHGHWGDVLALAAAQRELSGLLINGSTRDSAEIQRLAFPVFHRAACPRQTTKRFGGQLAVDLEWAEGVVSTGDLVLADEDGVVVVAAGAVDRVLPAITLRIDRERTVRERILVGETTLDVLGLPAQGDV